MRMIMMAFMATVLATSSCKKDTSDINPKVDINNPSNLKNYTYLALGDSYTIGESVATSGSFPYQLIYALRADSINVAQPRIVARTGWTTSDLINAINGQDFLPSYDFVTLLIGVNNQYRNNNIDIYRTEFRQLLNTSIAFAGGKAEKVFVVSIPDYGVTPFGKRTGRSDQIGREIDAYNVINKEETLKTKAKYIDITPISREADTNTALVADDGLHPSSEMYLRWVKQLQPLVKSAVK